MMGKGEWRALMRARRKALSPAARAEMNRRVCAFLEPLATTRSIAVYLAGPEEIDLKDFIRAALEKGSHLFAPRWTGEMYELAELRGLEGDVLRVGPKGILEPRAASRPVEPPALWLVPGLAFTRDGRRLGYGGGWYDRLLADAPNARALGIAADFQVVDELPMEPYDRRLSGLVIDSEGIVE